MFDAILLFLDHTKTFSILGLFAHAAVLVTLLKKRSWSTAYKVNIAFASIFLMALAAVVVGQNRYSHQALIDCARGQGNAFVCQNVSVTDRATINKPLVPGSLPQPNDSDTHISVFIVEEDSTVSRVEMDEEVVTWAVKGEDSSLARETATITLTSPSGEAVRQIHDATISATIVTGR